MKMLTLISHLRIWVWAGCLCAAAGLAAAQAAGQPALPVGVRLLDAARLTKALPPNYAAAGVVVNWTEPRLMARGASSELVKSAPAGEAEWVPPQSQDGGSAKGKWTDTVDYYNARTLLIQLIEPMGEGTTDSLPAYRAGFAPAPDVRVAHRPRWLRYMPNVQIGGEFPWLLGGPAQAEVLPPGKALYSDLPPAAFAARWLGWLAASDTLGNIEFERRLLLSLTRADGTETQFILVWKTDDTRGEIDEIRTWLATLGTPDSWLAIHATGPQVTIGMGDWRLGPAPDPRRAERVGAVLALWEAGELGDTQMDADIRRIDLVDWGRVRGARWSASSSERDYSPWLLGSGRTVSDGLTPAMWMSRPARADQREPEWCEVKFDNARPVYRIKIFWAAAAGWDRGFNPGHAELEVADERGGKKYQIEGSGEAVSVIDLTPPQRVRSLHLTLTQPQQAATPAQRARVVSIQVLGPWESGEPKG